MSCGGHGCVEYYNSIFSFFDNFSEYNDEKWKEYLSNDYKDISTKKEKEKNEILEALKNKGIYDYSKEEKYIEFFICLGEKKEAFSYLLNNTTNNIRLLSDKIEPTNKRITPKDINDIYECVGTFEQIKKLKNNFKIFEFIKKLDEGVINKFINFVRVYPAIAQLNQNFEFSNTLYDEVKNIIINSNFTFNQDDEIFIYYSDEGKKTISFEGLKRLNNKIHIKKRENINSLVNSNLEGDKNYENKYKMLIAFKELVDNIESIYENMTILRLKGSSLPIIINITVDNLKIEYFLASKKVKFQIIQKFLFNP